MGAENGDNNDEVYDNKWGGIGGDQEVKYEDDDNEEDVVDVLPPP